MLIIDWLNSLIYSRPSYWLAVSTLFVVLVYPLTIDTVPPLLDYPIHLARSYITIEYATDPMLREIFEIDWRPIPNLASDIILLVLGEIFEIERAGRILLAICLVTTVISVIFLHRTNFGYWGWWPLLSIIPAYHGALTAGFINYSIGIALIPSFLAFSKVLDRRTAICQILANSVFAMILFFCHVISVGIFGVFLFGCKFLRFIKETDKTSEKLTSELAIIFIPFMLPAFLYIKNSLSIVIERNKSSILGPWDIDSKIRGLIMPFLSGEYLIDLLSFVVVVATFIFLTFTRKIIIDRGLFIGIILMIVLFIVLPGHMLDAAFIADRLSVAIILVTIASTNPQRIKSRYAAIFAALVLALAAGRAASMTASWTESGRYYLRLTEVAGMVQRGSTVMILSPMTELREKGFSFWHDTRMTSPNWHFALLNIPALHAFSVMPLTKRAVFSQLHFVWADKQILSLTEPYRDLDYGDGGESTWDPAAVFERNGLNHVGISHLVERFDYTLVVYADRLSPKLRREIESQAPLYVDKELILLKVPSSVP